MTYRVGEIRTYQARWDKTNKICPLVEYYERIDMSHQAYCMDCGESAPLASEVKHKPGCRLQVDTITVNMKGQIPYTAMDKQVDGQHYKDMKIQPVEYCHANNIPFMEGCVIKYVSRHRQKNGVKDVEKAIHFLEMLMQLEYGKAAYAMIDDKQLHDATAEIQRLKVIIHEQAEKIRNYATRVDLTTTPPITPLKEEVVKLRERVKHLEREFDERTAERDAAETEVNDRQNYIRHLREKYSQMVENRDGQIRILLHQNTALATRVLEAEGKLKETLENVRRFDTDEVRELKQELKRGQETNDRQARLIIDAETEVKELRLLLEKKTRELNIHQSDIQRQAELIKKLQDENKQLRDVLAAQDNTK